MKLEYYKKALALMVIPFFIASCELLGLDYQDSYDYDYSCLLYTSDAADD